MQSSLFDSEPGDAACEQLRLPDADITVYPKWLSSDQASHFYTCLSQTIQWRQDTIKLYGKEHLVPRLQAWYGDSNAEYAYSGIPLRPQPWTSELQQLKAKCERTCGHAFNSVLLNWYQNGQHSMGMHSDDEPQLGTNPVIASISLGQTRRFRLQHKYNGTRDSIDLTHGSLLIMAGQTQHYWQHGINKSKRPLQGRINLTFRWIQHDH